jgi:hypothetical protein
MLRWFAVVYSQTERAISWLNVRTAIHLAVTCESVRNAVTRIVGSVTKLIEENLQTNVLDAERWTRANRRKTEGLRGVSLHLKDALIAKIPMSASLQSPVRGVRQQNTP